MTSKKVAKDYGRFIYKCVIDCNNIKMIDLRGKSYHDYNFDYDINEAYNDEYDCVVFKNIMDSKEPEMKVEIADTYVIFDKDKIKIIG
jgi:hypothetical protein